MLYEYYSLGLAESVFRGIIGTDDVRGVFLLLTDFSSDNIQ